VFERYTDEARRVIFFARAEAGRLGADSLEAKHLFLGLLVESPPLISRLIAPEVTLLLRGTVERTSEAREPIPDSMDLKCAENAVIVMIRTKMLANDPDSHFGSVDDRAERHH
jgi:ATP-dependent Clp protease ATP-binding subunit ClpC